MPIPPQEGRRKNKDEMYESIESKLNTAIGMLTVPAMTGDDKRVKDAHSMLVDATFELGQLYNEYLL
jgi:hypothetical protein